MLSNRPIFPGKHYLDQLNHILGKNTLCPVSRRCLLKVYMWHFQRCYLKWVYMSSFSQCKIYLKMRNFTSLTNRLQIKLWVPVNDVLLGATPRAASPICQFSVHASCQWNKSRHWKYAEGAVWNVSLCFPFFVDSCVSNTDWKKLIHNYLLRHPGVSVSGGSQLHHQHQGQELSFVTANALQSAMEPSFSQCRSQRLDPKLHIVPHKLLIIWLFY